jgi:two-component system response regulator (stage 0 sporulation protein F)
LVFLMNKKAKVLIVDDQEGVRELLLETCLVLGYEADAIDSGQEALGLVQKNNYQLVLVDMKMPGLDGLTTTEQILEMNKQLKVVMITGFDDSEDDLKEISENPQVVAVMKKPFAIKELEKILAENIAG